MEDLGASKLIPSAKIQPTIHPSFPTEKISFIDHSIEKILPCIIHPESVDLNDLSSIEFIAHECSGHYLDLSSIKLEVKLQLLDADGARDGIVDATKVYFVNNLLQSLFPVVKVYINNENVETNYHSNHLSRLSHMLDTPASIISNRGEPHGLFPINQSNVANEIDAPLFVANEKRIAFSKKGIIHLKGFISLDICTANKCLLDMCTLRIVLESARNSYCINAIDDAVAFKKNIQSVRLHIDRIKPSPGGFLATTKYLQNQNLEYIYRRNVVHSEILAQGQRSLTISRPFTNRVPHKFHIFMVDQTAESGSYKKDPYYYNSNKLSNYRVMLNGEVISDIDCSVDEGYVNVYHDSLIAHGAEENFIPYELFAKGSFIITVSCNSSQNGQLSYENKGNLSIFLKFEDAIPHTQIVFVVGSIHSTFEITADRNCISNFGY